MGAVDRVEVPFSLHVTYADAVSPRRGEPVRVGVPLPRGRITDRGTWTIVRRDAVRVPAQARTVEHWPDGSLRWVWLDFSATHEGKGAEHATAVWEAQPVETVAAGRARTTAGGLVVETGAAQFTFGGGINVPFADVHVDGASVLAPERSRLEVTTADGHRWTWTQANVRVDDDGPQRSSVVLSGHAAGPSSRRLDIETTIDLFAGLPAARVSVRIRNPHAAQHPGGFWDLGDVGSLLLEGAVLRLALDRAGTAPAETQCAAEMGESLQPVARPFEIYQDSSGGEHWNSSSHVNRTHDIPVSFAGYRLTSGDAIRFGRRATPVVVHRREGRPPVACTRPHFWQNFPTAIAVDDDAILVHLWSRAFADAHELQGGEQKTHVVWFSFGVDPVTDLPLDWARNPLVAVVDPDWYAAAESVPWLVSAASDPYEVYRTLVSAAVEGEDTFAHKREVADEYGWRHFGDLYGDHEAVRHQGPGVLISHYNNQYDPVGGLITQCMRTGDARWSVAAHELARHVIDIDVYHTLEDKAAYNHGLFWHTVHYIDADTATHRSYPLSAKEHTFGGGPSADQNYTTGLMLYYFMTGDASAKETVLELAQYVIDIDDGKKTPFRWLASGPTGKATASGSYSYHGPGRAPANSLNALLDGHRLSGASAFMLKAEEVLRRTVHPEQDIDALLLIERPEDRWFYLMFLQVLGKYVMYKAEIGQCDEMHAYGHAALLHFARWMATHEIPFLDRPERLEFPTETWPAQDMRKADIFFTAAFLATGTERERFLERGAYFFDYACRTLASMPTRTKCRPVVLLLSNGYIRPGVERACASGAVAPAPRTVSAFPRPVEFVPQKDLAMSRARIIVAVAGVMTALAAVAIGWHFL